MIVHRCELHRPTATAIAIFSSNPRLIAISVRKFLGTDVPRSLLPSNLRNYHTVMCGRFTLRSSPRAIATEFDLFDVPDLRPRYNIAPTQQIPIIRMANGGTGRELAMVRWGLIPFWADDPTIGNRMINARADTVAIKPSFRHPFKLRRCLVVADGFFEWKKD